MTAIQTKLWRLSGGILCLAALISLFLLALYYGFDFGYEFARSPNTDGLVFSHSETAYRFMAEGHLLVFFFSTLGSLLYWSRKLPIISLCVTQLTTLASLLVYYRIIPQVVLASVLTEKHWTLLNRTAGLNWIGVIALVLSFFLGIFLIVSILSARKSKNENLS